MSSSWISLKKIPTAWVFLVAAASDNDNNNDRHIIDLAWGLKNLLISGVQQKDIYIFLDSQVPKQNIDNHLSNLFTGQANFNYKTINDFINVNNNFFMNYQNLVVFVFGHGHSTGLDSLTLIPPCLLTNKIRTLDGPTDAILYLGQCYAGIFNYLDVGTKNNVQNKISLIVIGATELQESLSLGINNVNLYNGSGVTGWLANIFMYNLFQWFSNPVDIDGDGYLSILDSYKFTEFRTNIYLKQTSANLLNNFGDLHGKRSNFRLIQSDPNLTVQARNQLTLDIAALESIINEQLNLFTVKQESWLLNANHSRGIGI